MRSDGCRNREVDSCPVVPLVFRCIVGQAPPGLRKIGISVGCDFIPYSSRLGHLAMLDHGGLQIVGQRLLQHGGGQLVKGQIVCRAIRTSIGDIEVR